MQARLARPDPAWRRKQPRAAGLKAEPPQLRPA